MSHFVRLFKPRFAALVESGAKLQTVRPTPMRMPRPGDTISLRTWTGKPYRSKMRVLRESVVTVVAPVHINEFGISHVGPIKSYAPQTGELKAGYEAFARADGFKDFAEMRDWFLAEHGLPFTGIVIFWT